MAKSQQRRLVQASQDFRRYYKGLYIAYIVALHNLKQKKYQDD